MWPTKHSSFTKYLLYHPPCELSSSSLKSQTDPPNILFCFQVKTVSKVRASVISTSFSIFLGLSHVCCCCLGTQLWPIPCNPVDCSPSGSSVHGIFQARILQWVATPSFRGSSQPRYETWVSRIAGRFFTIWGTREAQKITNVSISTRELNPSLPCDRWGL